MFNADVALSELIEHLAARRDSVGRGEQGRHLSIAITDLENALMRLRMADEAMDAEFA